MQPNQPNKSRTTLNKVGTSVGSRSRNVSDRTIALIDNETNHTASQLSISNKKLLNSDISSLLHTAHAPVPKQQASGNQRVSQQRRNLPQNTNRSQQEDHAYGIT